MKSLSLFRSWRGMVAVLGACWVALAQPVAAAEANAADADFAAFARACDGATDATALKTLAAPFEGLVAKYPESSDLKELGYRYLQALKKADFDAYGATAARWLESPNPGVAKIAREAKDWHDRVAVLKKGVKLKFTGADGREVDTEQLRGKAVLIVFWATWCGPCKEEIPHLKDMFAQYHDQGLELVGISLEMAGLQDADSPAQRTAKLEKSRQAMLAFTQQQQMPWPQYFDGLGFENPYAQTYNVDSIPLMILLDRTGKVVWYARGPGVDEAVKTALAQ